jgi:branched-chain amino acid aminotransferase
MSITGKNRKPDQQITRIKSSKMNTIFTWKLTLCGDHYDVTPYDLKHPAKNLDEASLQLPGGAYTTFRTYQHTKVLRIEDHIQRLSDSAARAQHPEPMPAMPLRDAIRTLLRTSCYPEARIRITLDLEVEPGRLYFSMDELHVLPASDYANGVNTTTRTMQRENPKAKLTSFITTAASYRANLPVGANETLMVQADGRILEGLSSNFFGIRAGEIWTADEGVLSGITRATVIDVAGNLHIPIHFKPVRVDELEILEEGFITSAGRGILPVVQVDETIIGTGKPGPVTRRLMSAFDRWIESAVAEV